MLSFWRLNPNLQKMCGGKISFAMIPNDLLPEILCRLPSQKLLTLKAVSKDWLRLITNRKFIKKHLEISKASCDEPIIFLVTPLSTSDAQINIINSFTAKPCQHGARLLGSCDGLVLYLDIYHRKISAVNPSTGKSVLVVGIPSPEISPETLISSWFGHHPCTGASSLVLVSYFVRRTTRLLVFDVYTLYHGCTLTPCRTIEEIDGPYCFFFENVGTLLRGRLHCLAMMSVSGESTILQYDFETTKVERMWCPQQKYPMLGVVDGCLCSMDRTEIHELGLGLGFDLWVMREYGVKESWTKLAKIEGFDYCYKLTPFAFCPNGDVVLCDKERLELVKYSFREKEIKFLNKYTSLMGGVGVACVGSLVSPASIWS